MKRFSLTLVVIGAFALLSPLHAQTIQEKAQHQADSLLATLDMNAASNFVGSRYLSDSGGTAYGAYSDVLGSVLTSPFTWLSSTVPASNNSTQFAANGLTTTGVIGAPEIGLLSASSTFGGVVKVASGFSQMVTYTLPDPGTTSANVVLDAGNSTIGGNKTFSGHISSSSTAGAATNDGTVVNASSVVGSDIAGVITLTTTTTAGEGTVTVPFAATYGTPPIVIITPANLIAQAGGNITGFYVSTTATNFTLNVKGNGTAAAGAKFNYMVLH